MSKCFQSCFASYHWWRLQRLCIYEFSFLCSCSWLRHWNSTLQNTVLQGCWMYGATRSCRTVRGEREHLPPRPLLSCECTPSLLRRATGWIAVSLHRKGQRHGGKGRRSIIQHKKVSSEPNELQGGQAQHVLSKQGLCEIPDKILAMWWIPCWSIKSAAPAQDEKYPAQPAPAMLERQPWPAQPPAVSLGLQPGGPSVQRRGEISLAQGCLAGFAGCWWVRDIPVWQAGSWAGKQDGCGTLQPQWNRWGNSPALPLAPQSGFPPLLPICTNPWLPWPCW